MSNVSSSDSDQTQVSSEQDRVFNVETCRALRRKARSRAAIATIGFALAYFALWSIAALFPASLLVEWLAVAYVLAVIVTGLWVAMPPREVWHELWREIIWDIARKLDWEHKLPPGYQPLADDDEPPPEPPAVSALAAGRAPLDWAIIIGLPAAGAFRVIVMGKVSPVVGLAGCVVLGAFFFHLSRGGLLRPTFSPEEPAHSRREEPDE